MNPAKIIFGFFIVLAATLNFGFFSGGMDNALEHGVYELFAAIVVNVVATLLKLGDTSNFGAIQLSTSLVAVLQLLAAAMVWGYSAYVVEEPAPGSLVPTIVSLSGGAFLANLISICLLIADTTLSRK